MPRYGRRNGLGKDYHEHFNSAPGGWGCPCCNPYGCSPNKMKAKAHRKLRRIEKQKLQHVSTV